MAGGYSDNQPDFSFLHPYETKSFRQYWYPIQEIGPATHANLDAAGSLRLDNGGARVGVAVTGDVAHSDDSVDGLTTVVIVHETTAPELRVLVAVCSEHLKILERAPWARVDELVGFSSVMDCEACRLPDNALLEQPTRAGTNARRSHLRSLPTRT